MSSCSQCDQNKPKLPPAVLEVINNEPPVLFHKVVFPASIGDDKTNPPDSLNYKNVLLNYEANNHSYLYSSDGVPTLISMGELDVDEIMDQLKEQELQIEGLQGDVAALQDDLQEEAEARETAIVGVTNKLSMEESSRIDADNQLQAQIATNRSDIATNTRNINELSARADAQANELSNAQTSISNIKSNLDVFVEEETEFNGNESTVTVNHTKVNLSNNTTTNTTDPLPVASETQAGVMNTATYTAIQENSENIDSILNGAIALNSLPASPTQDELTSQWKTATGKTVLVNRASIFDESNNKLWTYYTNTNTWYSVGADGGTIEVNQFTNDSAGIIKGSEEDGQVFAEANGTGSVVGWDAVKHDIDNLSQLVAGIDVPSVVSTYTADTGLEDTDVYSAKYINSRLDNNRVILGSSANSSANNTISIGTNTGSYGSSAVAIGHFAEAGGVDSVALGRGAYAGSNGSVALGRDSANSRNAEVSIGQGGNGVYATRFLSNVHAGELDTDAVNKKQMEDYVAENAGSAVLYDTYSTGTDGANTANFINSKLNGDRLALGGGASSNYTGGVAIGQNATSNTSNGIAIGSNTVVFGGGGIAIGYFAEGGAEGVALGREAYATNGSVALGRKSSAAVRGTTETPIYEVSIGGIVGTPYATRFLSNVHAGELDTDAVNVAQLNSAIASLEARIEALELATGGGSLN